MATTKTIVAAGVEDDQLVLAHATLSWTGQYHQVDNVSGFSSIPRTAQNSEGGDDDLGNIKLDNIAEYVGQYAINLDRPIAAIGVSIYGNIHRNSYECFHVPNFGPEKGTVISIDIPDLLKKTEDEFGNKPFSDSEIVVDNDASAAAMGEYIIGAGRNSPALVYVWAGRGINAGLILNNDLWEGRLHPEIGHFYPKRYSKDLTEQQFLGDCSIHQDCMIGLSSYGSILHRKKIGMNLDAIADAVAYYYAHLCLNLNLTVSPERIVIGGYVIRKDILPDIIPRIQREFKKLIGDYPEHASPDDGGDFIREASLKYEASAAGMIETVRRHLDVMKLKDVPDA